MICNTSECIDFFVLNDDPARYRSKLVHPWAFCVHVDIFEDLAKVLDNACINVGESKIVEYELKIDGKCYDMRVIILPPGNDDTVLIIRNAIKDSQVSFSWRENPNLFIKVDSFNILQEFITKENLQPYVLKIDHQPSVFVNNENIAVVTFNQSVSEFNIIKKFDEFLRSVETYHRPNYYYITYAFPWLQPRWLKHFEIRLSNELNALFLIILNHLGTLNYYTDELNIFDLLALRLTLCDYRNPLPSNVLKYEIDFMVKRILGRYVKNGLLDLDKYCIAQNCMQRDMLIGYMIYEFQYLFQTVKNVQFIETAAKFQATRPMGMIELAHESDAHQNTATRTRCQIAGRKYDTMSLSFFLDLIECVNIYEIRLDTDYTFHRDKCKLNRSILNNDGNVNVYFEGSNTHNFIEDFVRSLKTVTLSSGTLSLYIYCDLIDYTIFDNLSVVCFYFNDINISTQLLRELHQCNLKSSIGFSNCTFENTSSNWALLNKLREFDMMEILEDEGTWQSIFEYVWDELQKSNLKEFRFDKKNLCIIDGPRNVSLASIKFIIDELNSKLELHDTINNIMVDLYDLKFELEPDYSSDYDFYQ